MGCQLCGDSRRRAYLCSQDFSKYLEGRREELSHLRDDFNAQLRRLAEATHAKAQAQAHATRLQQVAEEAAQVELARVRAVHALAAAHARKRALLTDTRRRSRALHEAQKKLAVSQATLQKELRTATGHQAQSSLNQMDGLILELQRRVIQRLLDIFPLQTLAPDPAPGGGGPVDKHPTVVFIATLPLPDPQDDLEALLPTSPQFAALGMLCVLLDLLGRTLRLPLLHRSRCQGSASSVWEAGPHHDPHPLRGGVRLLERSAACLCQAIAGPAPRSVPPLAMLALLCRGLASGAAGGLSASLLTSGGAEGPAGAQSVMWGGGGGAGGGGGGGGGHDPGAEGWEVMPLPIYGRLIPPPPSADDDVEHWMRAMYDEENARGGGGGGGGAGGAAAMARLPSADVMAAQYARLRAALWDVWDSGIAPRLR